MGNPSTTSHGASAPSTKTSGSGAATGSKTDAQAGAGTRTLSIDIGGTGLKAAVLGPGGEPVTEHLRVQTPRPATPQALLAAISALIKPLGKFDRVSAGFPGLVVDGITRSAPNLHDDWRGYDLASALEQTTGRPVRVLNDAGVHGYAVIEEVGLEMVLTLGTGLGSALFYDGVYIPNLELAHHPFKKEETYEDLLGVHGLEKSGTQKWNKHLEEALATVDAVWHPRRIYLGGGNTKHLRIGLPAHVMVIGNVEGLLGGIKLWRDAPDQRRHGAHAARAKPEGAP
jgi:polyphosphate glucokinase